jgi:hypothetical protein
MDQHPTLKKNAILFCTCSGPAQAWKRLTFGLWPNEFVWN